MKITSIHAHYVRIPFDQGAPKQDFAGLRFPPWTICSCRWKPTPASPAGVRPSGTRSSRRRKPRSRPTSVPGSSARTQPTSMRCTGRRRRRSISLDVTGRSFMRTQAWISRCGTSPANAPACRSAICSAAQGARRCTPTPASCATSHRGRSAGSAARWSSAASSTSSCTSTASRRSGRRARARARTSPS